MPFKTFKIIKKEDFTVYIMYTPKFPEKIGVGGRGMKWLNLE